MNSTHDLDPIRHQAQLLSTRLGELAAGMSHPAAPPPSRLSAILLHLQQRSQAKQEAMHKLKSNELVSGG
jgi:hypothetical protein